MYVHASDINVYVHITMQTTQERVPQNEYCWIPSERVGIMWGERLGVSVSLLTGSRKPGASVKCSIQGIATYMSPIQVFTLKWKQSVDILRVNQGIKATFEYQCM